VASASGKRFLAAWQNEWGGEYGEEKIWEKALKWEGRGI